ncbi:hypothetical protein [Paractinoplanes rishiriensis]|uniref:Extracellular repeat protein, HAF family n=1 Tax=Paractinoplanes rishiriensis TaxID=1050105 RepID=A0A919K5K6_9ACTN|nr:hypothetical protein [Actinoplanes rishiriensis]GIE99737.1 hypothetical protein Ari01nite_72020 [Actinoplanes rishiriensis]
MGREPGTLGGATGVAVAVNDRDEVAGTSSTATGGQHAFRWSRGRMTGLAPLPGFQFSEAADINEHGWVVGTSYGTDGWRATLWRNGHPINLTTRNLRASDLLTDLNNRAHIAGFRDARPVLFRLPQRGPTAQKLACPSWQVASWKNWSSLTPRRCACGWPNTTPVRPECGSR